MENFTETLKYLANTNTINFLVMVVILWWICKKINLTSAFEKSSKDIKILISKSDATKAAAQKHLAEAKKLINGLPNDIETIEKNSADKIQIFTDEIKRNTIKTIENFSVNADKIISIEEKKISNLLTESTSKQTVELARENLKNILAQKPELHDKFIENSITELEKVKL